MPDGNQSDALHDRLRGCDSSALADAFAQHRQRLWRIVNFRMDRRMSGRVDPDDVLQEAYLAASKRLEHYGRDGFSSPFLWLRLIVQQTLIDVHRRHLTTKGRDAGRESPIFGRHPQATSASLAICLVGGWTSPSQAAVRVELVDQVQAAIGTMSTTDQEILALRHFEELTNSEAAEALEIEPKAASIRYVRAILRLKDVLSGFSGFLEGGANG
jgi:RNA polymerase sigma-70 factor, ECF subfamily